MISPDQPTAKLEPLGVSADASDSSLPGDAWQLTDEIVVEDRPPKPVDNADDATRHQDGFATPLRYDSSSATTNLPSSVGTRVRAPAAQAGPPPSQWKRHLRRGADTFASIPTPATWKGWLALLLVWPAAEWLIKAYLPGAAEPFFAFVLPWFPATLVGAGVVRWWRRRNGWDFWGTRRTRRPRRR